MHFCYVKGHVLGKQSQKLKKNLKTNNMMFIQENF